MAAGVALACAAPRRAAAAPKPLASDAGTPADAGAAVGASAEAPGDVAALQSRATDPHADEGARTSALESLAQEAGIGALPTATLCLKADARAVRLAAAQVLGRLGGANARTALQAQLANETDPEVRTALERALAKSEP